MIYRFRKKFKHNFYSLAPGLAGCNRFIFKSIRHKRAYKILDILYVSTYFKVKYIRLLSFVVIEVEFTLHIYFLDNK